MEVGLVISCCYFQIILLIIFSHCRRGEYDIPDKKLWFYMMLFIVYATYGNHFGDYFGYDEMIMNYGKTPWFDVGVHMEPQYYYLAKIVNGNPLLWRLTIGCISFIGLGFFLKQSDMNNYPTLLFFAVASLFWAAGHRGWWGIIYFFFGVYLCFYKKKLWYLIFCFVVLYSHASHIAMLCLLPLAFFRFNKYIAIIAIASMFGFTAVFHDYFNSFLMSGMEDEYAAEKINAYTAQGGNKFLGDSIGEILQNVTSKGPSFVFLFYLFWKMICDKSFRLRMSREVNALSNISFGLSITSVLFILMNMNSGTFSTRLFTMASFPIMLIAPSILTKDKRKYYMKYIKWRWISIELTYFFALYYSRFR